MGKLALDSLIAQKKIAVGQDNPRLPATMREVLSEKTRYDLPVLRNFLHGTLEYYADREQPRYELSSTQSLFPHFQRNIGNITNARNMITDSSPLFRDVFMTLTGFNE